ncbi:MAG: polyprenol monophosphomannose synthase [Candidatus Aminicenantes bacterium]
MAENFSLVIPTYNEKENIGLLLDRVRDVLGWGGGVEIIVVDDDSPDFTWRIVQSYSQKDRRIKIIRRINQKGLSQAVMEGFKRARGQILGVMDADLSHDHRILPEMIAAVQDEGCDLVVGSRRIPGGGADKWPWFRKISSDVATLIAKCLLDIKLSDPMSGYFLLKRELFIRAKNKINPRGYKILLEIYIRSKPQRIKEIPFVFKDRNQGYSKASFRVLLEYLHMLYLLRFK